MDIIKILNSCLKEQGKEIKIVDIEKEAEILPCPFCSHETIINYPDNFGYISKACGSCGTKGPRGLTYDQAIKLWNQRI